MFPQTSDHGRVKQKTIIAEVFPLDLSLFFFFSPCTGLSDYLIKGLKKLFESWRSHLDEKVFADYEAEKGEWVDIPADDFEHDPENIDFDYTACINKINSKVLTDSQE